jgi:hypothetical protein
MVTKWAIGARASRISGGGSSTDWTERIQQRPTRPDFSRSSSFGFY